MRSHKHHAAQLLFSAFLVISLDAHATDAKATVPVYNSNCTGYSQGDDGGAYYTSSIPQDCNPSNFQAGIAVYMNASKSNNPSIVYTQQEVDNIVTKLNSEISGLKSDLENLRKQMMDTSAISTPKYP